MKTVFRVLAVGASLFGMAWCLGTNQDEAKADTAGVAAVTPALEPAAPADDIVPAPTSAEPNAAETPIGVSTNALSLSITNLAALTNADALKVSTNLIVGPTIPESLNPSQPLTDVIKLVQAGVNEEVLLAFIAGATEPFNASSSEIIYLHDIGLGPNVLTALLQHDSTPEMQARRQANEAVKPLPPGVGLTTPATNIYTPKETFDAPANPPEPEPVNPPGGQDSTSTPPAQPVSYTDAEQYDGSPAVTTVNYNYWYPSLAPYGSWVSVGGYGPCWRPTVAVGNSAWRPYGDSGRWLWTDAGWYWYSDYSWGWGPFHYGRWFCPPGVGWVWAPGRIWSPAWVSWRYAPSYCGWAPLPPGACYSRRSGFYFNSASVGIGCEFGLAASAYVFLPLNRFCDRRPYHYYITGGHAHGIHRDSTVINNYVTGNNNAIINRGIGLDRVSRATRGNIHQIALRDAVGLRDRGPRGEQLNRDGATLAVHRPDPGIITRHGSMPTPRAGSGMSVFRPRNEPRAATGVNPTSAMFTPNANALSRLDRPRLSPPTGSSEGPANTPAPHRPDSVFLNRLNASTPANAWPGGATSDGRTPLRPRQGQGSVLRGSAPTLEVGNAARPTRPSIIMRNPNPSRSGINRPVTYPFVPSTQQARLDGTPASPSRPSFVPRPPANASRPSYAPSANRPAPSVTHARPSMALPSGGPPARTQVSRPAMSAPSHSQPGARASGSSSSRGSQSVSRGAGGNAGGRR